MNVSAAGAPLLSRCVHRATCVHSVYFREGAYMLQLDADVSTREFRSNLSNVLGRVMYAGDRIGVTRNGRYAAVLISIEDYVAFTQLETEQEERLTRLMETGSSEENDRLDEIDAKLAEWGLL